MSIGPSIAVIYSIAIKKIMDETCVPPLCFPGLGCRIVSNGANAT